MKTLKQIIAEETVTSYRRVEALCGLVELAESDYEVLEYVLTLGDDKSSTFRHKWARLLSKINDPRVAQAFVERLEKEEDDHTLKTIIRGLAGCGPKSCIQFLEPFLEHKSHSIRHAAKNTIFELEYVPPPKPEPKEESEEEIIEEKPKFPRHRLPWRLKLKFFYRKYKLLIYSLLFLISLIPVSIGIYHGAKKVKELIASLQPTPEEIAERKRLEAERQRIKQEQRRLEEEKRKRAEAEKRRLEEEERRKAEEERRRIEEEQRRLEEKRKRLEAKEKEEALKNKKPINWPYYLKGLIIFMVFGVVIYLFNMLFSLLERKDFRTAKGRRYIGNDSKSKVSDQQEFKGLRKDEEDVAQAVNKKESLEPDLPEIEYEENRQGNKQVAKVPGYDKEVVSLSKRIIFSFLERFFRLFNSNYSKNVLKIFIPNDLFYKIRFFTMMTKVKTLLGWIVLGVLSLGLYIFLTTSPMQWDWQLMDQILSPFKGVVLIMLFCFMVYGFFMANPFEAKGLDLHSVMSKYYYDKKYYFRKGEQEQWSILLRHLQGKDKFASFSIHLFILKSFFGMLLNLALLFLIVLPLMNYFKPGIIGGLPSFSFDFIQSMTPSALKANPKILLYFIIFMCIFPPFAWIGWRKDKKLENEKKEIKKVTSRELERAQIKNLKNQFSSLMDANKVEFKSELKVLCGIKKKEWFEQFVKNILEEYSNLYLHVDFVPDNKAQEAIKNSHYHVWLPDNELKIHELGYSRNLEESTNFKNKGVILKTPLVYVFRKSVLKKFLEIYQSVDYRSITDATGTLRNLKEVDFSCVMPSYDDMDIGTYNLVLVVNEYFRTTRSYQGDVYKNKVFMRALKEYLQCNAESKDKNKSSVFITTEKEGIDFLEQKKGRGWQLVYPSMTLYMEHRFIILNDNPYASFLFDCLISNQVQKSLGDFGWRPGNFSVDANYKDLMGCWDKYKVPNTLGIHTHMPNVHAVKGMIKVAETALISKEFIAEDK